MRNNRGVALLVALLVTALLIALVFEFAYATRVSLRAAVNLRDSQRAYYLARSGVNLVGKLLLEMQKNGKLQDYLQQDWQPAPYINAADTVVMIRWEDEQSKINIANVSVAEKQLEKFFGIKQVDLAELDKLKELRMVRLLGELHRVLSDEEFGKVAPFLTVFGPGKIDINTASSEVLQSLGLSESVASLIIERRQREPFDAQDKINAFPGMDVTTAGKLDWRSNYFFVHAYATVGGYTKQADAVIQLNPFAIQYRSML